MSLQEKLETLCKNRLLELNLNEENYQKRLKEELHEIDVYDEQKYFLEIKEKGEKYENENNLLVPYLLGICDTVDINSPPKYEYGDSPDCDTDYIPAIRTILKEEFSKKLFGEDKICNIATYTTFGLRSSLIDMAKVFDLDRMEITAITKKLEIKDNTGENLTWDKAVEIYDELREYLERNPKMAIATQKILHRNRNMGLHASGLIISNINIKEFVPLVKKKNSPPASAWVEGLHGTDLGAVGLVKFDFLGLKGNMKIAEACRFADPTGNGICAIPGRGNWSNTDYLNDPKALEMANRGDLKMIFQFDGSDGIRRLTKQGGVTSFDDLVAYTSLFRPGCLKMKMHEVYCSRKSGEEEYELHPKLEFLRKTYGVLIYQEDIMKVLNIVGKIPLKYCEEIRKAISKKKIEKFIAYKEMFITNGQETLGYDEDKVTNLWKQIEASAGYSFNLSHATTYTVQSSRMLYLKANHYLAFACAVLRNTELNNPAAYQKIKDYKQDIQAHKGKLRKLDLNKSKVNFEIIDDEIYYGFSNIRGIGIEIAEKIVANQPYENYQDFLERFGTDASVNQAVIFLGLFGTDFKKLYKFYEAYKQYEKKRILRIKKLKLKKEEFKKIFEAASSSEEVEKLNAKYKTYMDRHMKGLGEKPEWDNFNEDIEIPKNETFGKLLTLSKKPDLIEEKFYGFIWEHPLEKKKEYSGCTFEKFDLESFDAAPVEVLIKEVKEVQGPKVTYYRVEVEDAMSRRGRINVWMSDYEIWKDELKKNNTLRIKVKRPTPPYPTYSLAPHQGGRFARITKENDFRIHVLT